MSRPRVAVVGGGLAGLASAVALCDAPCDVHLFEARRQLGGRAGSFRDSATGALVDFCQHVSMGCCTNLAEFCRRTNIDRYFQRERTLYFVGPNGVVTELSGSRWLPAPFHLASLLMRLTFLPLRDRLRVAKCLLALARARFDQDQEPTMLCWLQDNGQSQVAIARFWATVLVSALGDTLDRVSLSAGRKVFVDGFMRNRAGYEVIIPTLPLSKLFNEQVGDYLSARGVLLHLGVGVKNIRQSSDTFLLDAGNEISLPFDHVIIAVPWRQVSDVTAASLHPALPFLATLEQFESSPITGIHLWFDRPITSLPHAVIVDRLSQWLFNRGHARLEDGRDAHYYQVVISASRVLANRDRSEAIRQIHEDLASLWPAAKQATILQAKIVTEHHAVFTPAPNLDHLRPTTMTDVNSLFLAGDWTKTNWPATMEGAVRSGFSAAEAALAAMGTPRKLVVEDLPTSPLTRWLTR